MTDHQHAQGLPPKGGSFIPGLIKGLATTARTLGRPTHTAEYPDVQPHLPPRTRGVIALLEENCTSCMLCARECPDWCIYIDSHKETLPATTEGGRERQRNVLDRFAIDFSLCMYCGICVEVCPFDALHWSPEFEYAEFDIVDLVHEHFPQLQIVARARDVTHWNQLRDRGVLRVERELFESSLRSARSVLELLGHGAHEARRTAMRFRAHNLELFEKLHPHYKDRTKLIAVIKQGRAQLEEQMAQERLERDRRPNQWDESRD